jgi:hypothetical protein
MKLIVATRTSNALEYSEAIDSMKAAGAELGGLMIGVAESVSASRLRRFFAVARCTASGTADATVKCLAPMPPTPGQAKLYTDDQS